MISARNKLQGRNICLTALWEKDIRTILEWYGDTRFLELWDSDPLVDRTENAVSDWMEDLEDDKSQVVFGIRKSPRDKLTGLAKLDEVEWTNRVADISVAIGNPDHWGNGWGTEATSILLDYAFTELNLYRIQLTVLAYNTRAIRLYEKLGFRREGTFREFGERNGKRYDMFLYGMLKNERL